MQKIIKMIFIIGAAMAVSFAQAADSSKQVQTSKQEQSAGTVVTSNSTVNLPTDVKPRQPTNWSKIKDLFL
jgi:hypothetical protein